MARRFQFDDEDDNQKDYQEISHIDELEDMKVAQSDQSATYEYTNKYSSEEEGIEPMAKKKKKFVWKWWHYVLIVFGVLFIAFFIYIFLESRNNGPVYGSRCYGIVEIPNDLRKAAIDTAKNEHSEIQSLNLEVTCKQLKVDIHFKAGMKTKDAQKIAENVVQTLDKLVGKPKEDGKTYSTLFGKIDNVSQYEVNLYLTSQDSKDFPIFGTKHVQNDDFSYTLASVRDQKSKEKAESTLKDTNE